MQDINPEHAAILDLLKNNPQGMSLKQITDAMGMNRITVARYLDILKTSGRIEMEPYGQAKVYYLSNRVPISAMLDFTSSLIIIINSERKIVCANRPFLELFGSKEDEIRGKNISDIFSTEDEENNLMPKITEALSGTEVSEEIYIKKDDSDICFWMKMLPTVFYNGQPGLTILLENITERKRMEEIMILQKDLGWKLSAARTFEEALPLAIKAAIYILKMDAGGIFLVNDNTQELEMFFSEGLGDEFFNTYRIIKPDSGIYNIITKNHPHYLNEDEFGIFPESDRNNLKKEGIKSLAMIPIRYNGQLLASFDIASKRMTEFDRWTVGETEALASLTANVITRIKAINDLKNSEKRYRMLFNHANDMIVLNRFEEMEKEGRIIEANDAACKKLGYDRDEFLNLTIYDIDKNLKGTSVANKKEILLNNGQIKARRALQNRNGDAIPADISSHLISVNDSEVVLSIIKDLRENIGEEKNEMG